VAETSPLSILDLIDPRIAAESAKRSNVIGQMIDCVLKAVSPDAVFQDLAQQLLRGYPWETRRIKITMLAEAFGANRQDLKRYLRANNLCGPQD